MGTVGRRRRRDRHRPRDQLDIDGPTGQHALTQLERDHGPLPATRRARTARGLGTTTSTPPTGGSHGLCRPTRTRARRPRPRGAMGSPRPADTPAATATTGTAGTRTAPLPDWLEPTSSHHTPDRSRAPTYRSPTSRPVTAHTATSWPRSLPNCERVGTAVPGTRNSTLNRSAFRLEEGQLAGAGLINADELVAPLCAAARRPSSPTPRRTPPSPAAYTAGQRTAAASSTATRHWRARTRNRQARRG